MFLSGHRERLVGSLVQIIDDTDPRRSDKTLCAAALLTLGISPAGREYFHATVEMVRGALEWQTIWSFRQDSACGRFDTAAMLKAWDDALWLVNNPQHPLSIIRTGLNYNRVFKMTPRFSLEELRRIETPDTWLEAAARNLIVLLRDMPEALTTVRKIIRFGPDFAAFVPKCMDDKQQTRFLNYVERPDYRSRLRA
jgi:hypothetical protein